MADVVVPLAIITGLILLNGIFVAAEFAIVGVSRAEIEQAVRRGNRTARRVQAILEDPQQQDRFIATAQLGITAASLGLGMYGEHIVAHWIAGFLEGWGVGRWIAAHTLATILSVALLTYFHIVIGEMVPKALALQRAKSTALRVTGPMHVFQRVMYPFVLALNGLGNGLLRIVGVRRTTEGAEHFRTPEELAFIINESRAGGLLREDAANVLGELLELGQLTAAEVMLPRVHVAAIPAGGDDSLIAKLFRRDPHARYPIFEQSLDNIIGMAHVKDLLRAHVRGVPLADAAVRPVAFVPLNASIDDILTAMRNTRAQLVVVMDEHGGTAGIVTLEDIFEEVVGEVTDDRAESPEIYTDEAGGVRAMGTARIDEVAAALGVVLEFEEADTVSGLILALLKRPPRVGDQVVWEEAAFEVTAVRGHGVDEARITLDTSNGRHSAHSGT